MRFDLVLIALLSFGSCAALATAPPNALASPPAAAATSTAPQVLVSIKVVEIDRAELRRIGLDWQPQSDPNDPNGFTGKFGKQSVLPEILELLTTKKLAKVIASPNICMAVGRPTTFRSGSEAPVRTIRDGNESVAVRMVGGTEAECCVPAILSNGDLRVEIKLRLTSMIGASDSTITLPDGSQQSPPLTTFEVDTSFEVTPGETRVLSSPSQQVRPAVHDAQHAKRPSGEDPKPTVDIIRLVLVTPEIINAADMAAMRVAKSPSDSRRSSNSSK